MIFSKGNSYRHLSTLDIDVVVFSDIEDCRDYISFVALYWNRHYKIIQGDPEKIKIYKKDFHKWKQS